MCFSAPASFIVASGLSVAGAFSLKEASKKLIIPFALIPLFFALQQACEGLVWLYIDNKNILYYLGVYGFIFFASMFWPIWIPLSLLIAESKPLRKKLLGCALLVGLVVAGIYGISWIFHAPEAQIINHHMGYPYLNAPLLDINNSFEFIPKSLGFLYLIATVSPLFISSIRNTYQAGIVLVILCVIARVFYAEVFGSLWCFFAAVSSCLVIIIIHAYKKSHTAVK